MQVFITIVDHFGYGKEFNTELCTRLLPLVDDPPFPVVVRMNICMGQLCNVRMAQARKSAKDKDVTVDTRFVVG